MQRHSCLDVAQKKEGLLMPIRFALNENVVYPSHGVAKIIRIVEKMIAGNCAILYELRFVHKDITILVPTHNLEAIGIRPLSSIEKVNEVFKFLAEPYILYADVAATSNWKHRNKEYQSKLRRGSLEDIAIIYKELKGIERHKELSFCEKNLLLQTELLLSEEIALVKKVAEELVVAQLRALFVNHQQKSMQSVKQSLKIVQNVV
jgi:CarD family transcriptional regulator